MRRKWTDAAKETLRTLKYRRQAVDSMKKLLEAKEDPEVRERLRQVETSVMAAERALASLTGEQADILKDFYIERGDGYMDELCRKYRCARSTVYRLKSQALSAFSMTMFGSDGF